jgi:hypothetical protein
MSDANSKETLTINRESDIHMTVTNPERWKEIVRRLRLNAAFTVTVTWLFGGNVAVSTWKKHADFYPIQLIVLGFLTITYARASFLYLAGLTWSVVAEESKRKKLKARRLMACILCAMFVWFCSAVCLAAAMIFGKFYVVSAVVMVVFMIYIALQTDREIRRLASYFFNGHDKSFGDIVLQTPD